MLLYVPKDEHCMCANFVFISSKFVTQKKILPSHPMKNRTKLCIFVSLK